MTRKDYILIASALRDQYAHSLDFNTSTNPQAVLEVATGVAFALGQENPKFNREHFLAVVRNEKSLTSRPSKNGRQS